MFYKFEKVANPRVDWQVIWKQDFNNEFISAIRNSIEEDKWRDASVGGNLGNPGGKVDKKIRSVMHQPLKMGNYKSLQNFPHCVMAGKMIKANSEVWRFDLTGFNMITDTGEDKIILEYVVASNAYNENLDSLYVNIERP